MRWLIMFLVLVLSACTTEFESNIDVKNPTKDSDCQGVLCTLDLRSILIYLHDKNGDPINTDNFKVYFTETKEELDLTDRMLLSDLSQYFIASDNYMSKIEYSGTSITFEAKINKFKTWKHEFIIAKDCCHIYSPAEQVLEFEI